jgi:ATP-dependent DNA helicase RecG
LGSITPFEALREAIANAIIHRDYSMRGTSLMVKVYDDRVEIINPGVFPGAKKSDFGKISIRRNERIADIFFRMDKVERAGTGIRRMKEAMAAAGLPSPRLSQTGFYTIIFKRPVSEVLGEKLGDRLGKKLGEKAVERSVKKDGEKVGEKLTKNRQRIIDYMLQNKSISAKELAELVGISQRKMEKNISWLKEKGLIKRIGPDKGGYWEIVNA